MDRNDNQGELLDVNWITGGEIEVSGWGGGRKFREIEGVNKLIIERERVRAKGNNVGKTIV